MNVNQMLRSPATQWNFEPVLPRGVSYPITDHAIRAIEHGMKRRGISKAEMARRIGCTRQAIGKVLRRVDKGSELLPDMLCAVGEPELLAFPGLNATQVAVIETMHEIAAQLGDESEAAKRLMEMHRRIIAEEKSK